MFVIKHPVGSKADVKELEYICTLLKCTIEDYPHDASVNGYDISSFLCSRYGIKIKERDACDIIIEGGCSTISSEKKVRCVLDLLEIATLLVSASLSSEDSSREKDVENSCEMTVFGEVIEMMFDNLSVSRSTRKLDRNLLKQILSSYGEDYLANDDELIDEMVKAAAKETSDGILDEKAFRNALTGDLYQLDPKKIQKGMTVRLKRVSLNAGINSIKKVPTVPEIDLASDSHLSTPFMVLIWCWFIISYFAYFYNLGNHSVIDCGDCEKISSIILSSIANWMINIFVLVIQGVLFVGLGSLGNGISSASVFRCLLGCISVSFFTFTLFLFRLEFKDTFKSDSNDDICSEIKNYNDLMKCRHKSEDSGDLAMYEELPCVVALFLGSCLVLLQLYILYATCKKNAFRGKIEKKNFQSSSKFKALCASRGKA